MPLFPAQADPVESTGYAIAAYAQEVAALPADVKERLGGSFVGAVAHFLAYEDSIPEPTKHFALARFQNLAGLTGVEPDTERFHSPKTCYEVGHDIADWLPNDGFRLDNPTYLPLMATRWRIAGAISGIKFGTNIAGAQWLDDNASPDAKVMITVAFKALEPINKMCMKRGRRQRPRLDMTQMAKIVGFSVPYIQHHMPPREQTLEQ